MSDTPNYAALVARLRQLVKVQGVTLDPTGVFVGATLNEAADAIEALQAENAELRWELTKKAIEEEPGVLVRLESLSESERDSDNGKHSKHSRDGDSTKATLGDRLRSFAWTVNNVVCDDYAKEADEKDAEIERLRAREAYLVAEKS